MTSLLKPEASQEDGPSVEPRTNLFVWVGALIVGVAVCGLVVVVLLVNAWGANRACNPAASPVDPASVPAGPVAGYGHDQLVNAATIAQVAATRNLPQRAQLLGIMTSMGESSLVNVGYGDDINGITNPDGTPTCSLGLFQQQWCLGWGTREQVMDPVYASGAFYDRLVTVSGWDTLPLTLAINRTQGNADPYHYAKYEQPATEILTAVSGAKPGACNGNGEWTSAFAPATRLSLSDLFGWRSASDSLTDKPTLHTGIDLATASGTPVLAVAAGTVKSVSTVDGGDEGKNVRITHEDGTETRYLHFSAVLVRPGDKVTAGQPIGSVGSTGRSSGPHLHLSVLVDGKFVDPLAFMQARGVDYCALATPITAQSKTACQK